MKKRLLPLALTAALLLAFGAIAGACGGGGDGGGGALTLEEYFDRLETIAVDFDDRGTELEGQYDIEAAESEEEAIDLTEQFFREGLVVLEDFVEELGNLEPPAEVEAVHNEAVAAGEEAVTAFEDLIDQVADAESAADLEGSLEEFSAAGGPIERFSDSCFALQTLADDNSLDVDLRCG